jgi:hypothetical protein
MSKNHARRGAITMREEANRWPVTHVTRFGQNHGAVAQRSGEQPQAAPANSRQAASADEPRVFESGLAGFLQDISTGFR